MRLKWAIKQLFPLTYKSRFTEMGTGIERLCVWRMWFGRCYNVEWYALQDQP
jgi:hypothetical protein